MLRQYGQSHLKGVGENVGLWSIGVKTKSRLIIWKDTNMEGLKEDCILTTKRQQSQWQQHI